MIKWANNEMNFKKEVMELAGFLKIVKDPEGDLLLGLLHIIYEKFPPTDCKRYGLSQSSVFVRCPCDQALHEVSPFGFALLASFASFVKKGRWTRMVKFVEIFRTKKHEHPNS